MNVCHLQQDHEKVSRFYVIKLNTGGPDYFTPVRKDEKKEKAHHIFERILPADVLRRLSYSINPHLRYIWLYVYSKVGHSRFSLHDSYYHCHGGFP